MNKNNIFKTLSLSFLTVAGLACGILVAKTAVEPEHQVETNAAIPSGLYDSCEAAVTAKSYANLYTAVKNAAASGYSAGSYTGLWTWYKTTDVRSDGKIRDWYSSTTSYTPGTDQGSSASTEGTGGYNREHTIPKSWWGGATTAQGCDIYIVVPTDVYVNSKRSNYPFSTVSSATYTSKDGFKLGTSSASGITGTAFEPIDSLKGDFARIYFYAMAKWASVSMSTSEGAQIFSSSGTYGLTSAAAKLYYSWHKADPVDSIESNRNDLAASVQGNRNPYVDHPEYADYLYGGVAFGSSTTDSVTLNKSSLSLTVGGTSTLTATASGTVTWSTSNSSVATVSSGKVTAVAAGAATITATCGTAKATCTVTVTAASSTDSVSLDKTSLSLTVGNSSTLSATASGTVTWSTSNSSVATVSSGKVTAVAAGTATITATCGTAKATCTVTVTASGSGGSTSTTTYTLVTSISQLTTNCQVYVATAKPGESGANGVSGYNNNKDATVSTTVSDWVKYKVTVSSSTYTCQDPSTSTYIASPTANEFKYNATAGACTPNTNGYLQCNSRYLCANGTSYRFYTSVSSYTPFYVYLINDGSSGSSDSVSLDKSSLALNVGDTGKLTATASGTVSWTSTRTGVATVSNGTVTAVAFGESIIQATCGTAVDSALVSVGGNTQETALTPSQAITFVDNIGQGTSTNSYFVKGVVTSIATAYSSTYNNISVNLADTADGTQTFQAFRVTVTEDQANTITVGSVLTVNAKLTYYSSSTLYETSAGGTFISCEAANTAETFATEFLAAVTCDATGATAPTLSKTWAELATSFNALSSTEQSLLVNATYTVSGSGSSTVVTASGTTTDNVAKAMFRYDYIISKYGTSTYTAFITSRTTLVTNMEMFKKVDNNTLAIVVISAVLGTTSLLGYICLKRKED